MSVSEIAQGIDAVVSDLDDLVLPTLGCLRVPCVGAELLEEMDRGTVEGEDTAVDDVASEVYPRQDIVLSLDRAQSVFDKFEPEDLGRGVDGDIDLGRVDVQSGADV